MSDATPGPWTYDPLTGAIWGHDADSRDGYPVARLEACSRLLRAAQTNHANGRLIGAAPELLAACRLAAEHHQGSSSVPGRALRAAIAKAEGGGQ